MTQPRKRGWLAAIALGAGLAIVGGAPARADFDFQYYANPEILVATTPGPADITTRIGDGPGSPGRSRYSYTAADGSATSITLAGLGSGKLPLDASSSQDIQLVKIAIKSDDASSEFNVVFGVDFTVIDPTPGANPNDRATIRLTGMLSGKDGAWSFKSFTPDTDSGKTLTIGDMKFQAEFTGGTFAGRNGTSNLRLDGALTFRVRLTPVPEPNTFALIGIGSLGIVFACQARRRMRAA